MVQEAAQLRLDPKPKLPVSLDVQFHTSSSKNGSVSYSLCVLLLDSPGKAVVVPCPIHGLSAGYSSQHRDANMYGPFASVDAAAAVAATFAVPEFFLFNHA